MSNTQVYRYVAFLRAINVGGNRLVPMADLVRMFSSLGLHNVKTYIASGNVLFDSDEKDTVVLNELIERKLHVVLGFEVDTMIRSISEVENIIKSNPFKNVTLDKNTVLYVAFLSDDPTNANKKVFVTLNNPVDTFVLQGKELFILSHKDKGKSLFTNNLIEKKLGVKGTTRNWNTVKKVVDLFGS